MQNLFSRSSRTFAHPSPGWYLCKVTAGEKTGAVHGRGSLLLLHVIRLLETVLKPDRKASPSGAWSSGTACREPTLGLLNTARSRENSAIVLRVHREPEAEAASAARLAVISVRPGHAFLPPSCGESAARPAGADTCVGQFTSNRQYVGRINRPERQQLCGHVRRALLIHSAQALHNKSKRKVNERGARVHSWPRYKATAGWVEKEALGIPEKEYILTVMEKKTS